MKIQIKAKDGITIPKPGSEKSAGYDIVAISGPKIIGEPVEEDTTGLLFHSIEYIEYDTGLHIAPQNDMVYIEKDIINPGLTTLYHTHIFPRSSISNYNLALCNSVGTIDNDYRGEIKFRFKYITQPKDLSMQYQKVPLSDGGDDFGYEPTGKLIVKVNLDKIYKKDDRIGQLVVAITHRVDWEVVNELDSTERGHGGFGSTNSSVKDDGESYPPSTTKGTLAAAKDILDHLDLSTLYKKSGGIPIKTKYADEVKHRE
jgi:dUTPase